MGEGFAGLIGALIGATAALAGQWLTVRHQRRAQRRRELIDLVAKFWDSADRLWRASEGLDTTVFSLLNVDKRNNPDAARVYQERRIQQLADKHAAETEGRFLIAQMRLLYPKIAAEATALCDASLHFEQGRGDELRAARQAALERYEQAATMLLNKA
jgi:hypothetical protein